MPKARLGVGGDGEKMKYLFDELDDKTIETTVKSVCNQNVVLRPYQTESVAACFREWESVNSTLVCLPTGCHAAGHPILMHSGSVKSVEDIVVGDVVMGPDSLPRTVQDVVTGHQMMYRIDCKRGPSFVVNEGHVLHLECTREGKGNYGTRGGERENISVHEYLKKSKYWKHLRKLRSVEILFPERSQLIDAYLIGVLLGDGSVGMDHRIVHSQDFEIINSIRASVASLGCKIVEKSSKSKTAKEYHLQSSRWREHSELAKSLNAIGMSGVTCGDKFCPTEYLRGSTFQRLELLAGLIDTDGSLSHGGFDYVSKSKQLALDVAFVARSLGFRANISEAWKSCQTNAPPALYWRVHISGDTQRIQCRVKRKQAASRKQKKSCNRFGFTITPIGNGEYFGFVLDGDHLYVDGNFIVHHNTGKSVVFSEVMRLWNVEMQGRVLLIAHRKELITQALGHARRAGMTASIEMGQRWADHSDVIAASWQTMLAVMKCPDCHGEGCPTCVGLGKRKRMTRFNPGEIGLIIIDESHHAVAKSYRAICTYFKQNPQLKELHVTATPKRADKKGLHNVCDSVAYEMNLRTALEESWLVPIRQKFVTVHGLSLSDCRTRGGDFVDSDIEQAFLGLPEDEQRLLHEVAGPVVAEAKGERAIVFCAGKEHALKLTAAFNSYEGINAGAVFGDTEPFERATTFESFASGLLNVLVNVMVCTEGYDCPSIAVVANCRPTKSESMYLQIIGRGTRTLPGTIDGIETAEGRFKAIAESSKPFCTVLDFCGTSSEVKLVTVADILAGSSVKPVDLAEAKRIAMKSEETLDMDELIERVKRAREEKEERERQRKLKRTQTTKTASDINYTADDVSLYEGQANGMRSLSDQNATHKQVRYLMRLGMPRHTAERLSKRQAMGAISRLKDKQAVSNWKAKIADAGSVEGLRAVGERIKSEALKPQALAELRKAYSEHLHSMRE